MMMVLLSLYNKYNNNHLSSSSAPKQEEEMAVIMIPATCVQGKEGPGSLSRSDHLPPCKDLPSDASTVTPATTTDGKGKGWWCVVHEEAGARHHFASQGGGGKGIFDSPHGQGQAKETSRWWCGGGGIARRHSDV